MQAYFYAQDYHAHALNTDFNSKCYDHNAMGSKIVLGTFNPMQYASS